MGYNLKDLAEDEVAWLEKLADGRVHIVPTAMAERLQSLGLARPAAPVSADALVTDTGSMGTQINDDGLRLLTSEE
jgi:hypothetical protein